MPEGAAKRGARGEPKQIAVLVRRQQAEAFRVAAGMTLAGNGVDVYLLERLRVEDPEVQEQLDTLDLADISPIVVCLDGGDSSGGELPTIEAAGLAQRVLEYDGVLTL